MQSLPGLLGDIGRKWTAKPHNCSESFSAGLGETVAHLNALAKSLSQLKTFWHIMFWNLHKCPQTGSHTMSTKRRKFSDSSAPLWFLWFCLLSQYRFLIHTDSHWYHNLFFTRGRRFFVIFLILHLSLW